MAYSFEKGELILGDKVYTAFEGFDSSQATERQVIKGAAAAPLDQTSGSMDAGELTIEWTDPGEAFDFIEKLSSIGPYREVEFSGCYIMRDPRRPRKPLVVRLERCTLNDENIQASSGEATKLSMTVGYLYRYLNKKAPHAGMVQR